MLAISLANALGLTLLHALWQATAIVGVYRLAALLAPDPSPARRYRLGLVALIALIVAPLATFLMILDEGPAAIAPLVSLAAAPAFQGQMVWLVLDGLWAAGAGAMLLRTAADGWALRCLGRTTFAPPEQLALRFESMAREFGVATARLRLSIALDSPIAVGIVRPLIYLPVSAVTGLTPVQIDAVLAHELAHLRRADFAWNLVQTIVEALYFFHPAVWWLNHEIRIQREWCCDDEATAWCGAPMVYADALHRLASRRQTRGAGLAMALGGQPGLMLDRISRILGAPITRRQQSGSRLSLTVAPVCAAALLGLSSGSTADPRSRGSTPRPVPVLQPATPHPATSVPESASRPRPIPVSHVASTSMQASLPTFDSKAAPAPILAPVQSIDIERPVSPERRLADLRDAQRNEARMTPDFMAAQRARDAWITRNDPPPELHPPDG